jgi:Crp-like helix-turn-helix domain
MLSFGNWSTQAQCRFAGRRTAGHWISWRRCHGRRARHDRWAAEVCDRARCSASFNECLTAHPEVYKYLVECLAARLREANDALAAANFLNSEARLARAMLELAHLLGEHQGDGRILIQHPIRVYDLAAMAGIARENVSRILGGWERRGIVTRSSRLFYINEPEGLRRCIGESDSLLKERAGMHPL